MTRGGQARRRPVAANHVAAASASTAIPVSTRNAAWNATSGPSASPRATTTATSAPPAAPPTRWTALSWVAASGSASAARAWATPDPEFADHFALVRQVRAEALHVPPAAREAWLDAGPRRVQAVLADRLARLGDRGVLRVDDPDRTAAHFVALVAGEATSRTMGWALPISEEEIHESADAGLAAFLRAYGVGGDR